RLPTHGPTGSRSFGWESTGGYETFYALAIADPTAADRVSGHLERLAEGYQTGTNTVELEGWLKGLDQLLARLGSRADWQAVRIMHAP
ncbi:MAG: hypothetical protein GY731_12135, partial [Gammaproteobacteria bacterium]|nr:hypothetical protein [Gammaproteobacteria bacterium]